MRNNNLYDFLCALAAFGNCSMRCPNSYIHVVVREVGFFYMLNLE